MTAESPSRARELLYFLQCDLGQGVWQDLAPEEAMDLTPDLRAWLLQQPPRGRVATECYYGTEGFSWARLSELPVAVTIQGPWKADELRIVWALSPAESPAESNREAKK